MRKDVATLTERVADLQCQLMAADNLAWEVHRLIHGIEPMDAKIRWLQHAFAAYQIARQPSKAADMPEEAPSP